MNFCPLLDNLEDKMLAGSAYMEAPSLEGASDKIVIAHFCRDTAQALLFNSLLFGIREVTFAKK
jgi:hypothetical protein